MEFTHILGYYSSLFPSHSLIKKTSLPFTVMILSPHPDDESIIGALPLRLALENNAHVINVAVTLGSKKERQEERLRELEGACNHLQFELLTLNEDWKKKEKELKSLIQKYRPQLILAPHLKDFHPTHIKTGKLLKTVVTKIKYNGLIAWTEFWSPLKTPNLLLEIPLEVLELQIAALEFHKGEIARNPYHLRLPAWMMDNVRRGSELINNPGGSAAEFAFGILYQLQLCQSGRLKNQKLQTPILSSLADLGQIFNEILEAASGSKTKVK